MAEINALKSRVHGWGADLDARNRAGVPREKNSQSVTEIRGAEEYERIPQQLPRVEILKSTEHKRITPVFGTACPPHGLSGVLRRFAFRFSEGQKIHWMILLFADRVDVLESGLSDLVRGRLQNPISEYGLGVEFRRGGFKNRFGHNRADTKRLGQQIFLGLFVIGTAALVRRFGSK
jgi:hypothetical protein